MGASARVIANQRRNLADSMLDSAPARGSINVMTDNYEDLILDPHTGYLRARILEASDRFGSAASQSDRLRLLRDFRTLWAKIDRLSGLLEGRFNLAMHQMEYPPPAESPPAWIAEARAGLEKHFPADGDLLLLPCIVTSAINSFSSCAAAFRGDPGSLPVPSVEPTGDGSVSVEWELRLGRLWWLFERPFGPWPTLMVRSLSTSPLGRKKIEVFRDAWALIEQFEDFSYSRERLS